MPAGLTNRTEDNWAPLVAIADAAGGPWPAIIRKAALAAVTRAAEYDEPSASVRLLGDMRSVFDARGEEKIGSQAMVEHLIKIEDAPWATWPKGQAITPHRVARCLKEYGIKPRQSGAGSYWKRADFEDVWRRYVDAGLMPSAAPSPSNCHSARNPANTDFFEESICHARSDDMADRKPRKPNGHRHSWQNGTSAEGAGEGAPDDIVEGLI
jgi:hypothetical protein